MLSLGVGIAEEHALMISQKITPWRWKMIHEIRRVCESYDTTNDMA